MAGLSDTGVVEPAAAAEDSPRASAWSDRAASDAVPAPERARARQPTLAPSSDSARGPARPVPLSRRPRRICEFIYLF